MGTQNCVFEMNGGNGDNPLSGSAIIPTVQNSSTLVQPDNHSTVALDWTRVGGVVHNYVGLCKND